MVMGLRQIQKGDKEGLIRWLGVTALLGTVFIIGQYIEYYELSRISIVLGNNNAILHNADIGGFGARFYTPTFFHGAHVFVGVLWCLEVIRRARNNRYSAQNYVGIEVFGLYWHFVDVVWIILFALIYLV
jgi:heme/copper-type cytochrome/quinol oxidase subunit 3